MSLPIVTLDNQEKWDCHRCGVCCRGSIIPLDSKDLERLQQQRWHEQPEYRHVSLTVGKAGPNRSVRLAHQANGSCVFLSEEGLCRIHTKFGSEAKPTVCQTFPFQLIPHEKQAVLTVRRACPSAAADLGSPASNGLPFIRQLVRDQRLKADAISPPCLKVGEPRPWKTVRAVLELAGELLQDDRYPPVRRLVHALQYAGFLSAAKTAKMSDPQVIELASTLAVLASEESKPFFSDRQSPTGYSKVLFRLMAVDCARLHPECEHQSQWFARLQLMKLAWKVANGTGSTPCIGRVYGRMKFEELEKPLVAMRPEIYLPLNRFVETMSASYMYAIADRQGWSVVESIRGLAMLFPVGLWLLKWISCGREPTVNDMLSIVVSLDRSQGFAPLVGSLHRRRLAVLSHNSQLERVVVWYAR